MSASSLHHVNNFLWFLNKCAIRVFFSLQVEIKVFPTCCFSSVQLLSRVRLFVTPWTAAHQAGLPPCPSPTSRVYPNSCPLSRWCHPTISSSVVPFSSHLQSFPASGSFQMSQFSSSGGQSIGIQLQHQSFQ